MTPEDFKKMFDGFDPAEYEQEAQQRWGNTDAYRQSQRRVARYTKADWERMKAESAEPVNRLVSAMQAGRSANSIEAMDAAEGHRRHISDWFYDCTYEIHAGLAEMYLADRRFTATYETIAPGLAQYVHDAIKANAARHASSA